MCKICSIWAHTNVRSREFSPAILGGIFHVGPESCSVSQQQIAQPQLRLLLAFHNRPYLGVIQQDSCPAGISHVMEFASPLGCLMPQPTVPGQTAAIHCPECTKGVISWVPNAGLQMVHHWAARGLRSTLNISAESPSLLASRAHLSRKSLL